MEMKIKEMADKLAKSFEEQENIKEFSNLVKEIGIDGVKDAISTMEPEAQELFQKSLAKAVSMDKEAQAKTGPEPKQVESEDIDQVSEEDRKKAKGEKLVKESNAKVSHQGDNSELPGQVIKSETSETSEEVVEKGAFKELAIEELEKGELLAKMIEKMRKRGMDHDVCMSALKKKGYDTEMAKGKWEEMAKEQEAAEKLDKKDEKKEEVKKSINWASPNQRLEVSRKRGQDAHYAVDSYIAKSFETPEKEEVLEKAEKEFNPNDINDVIEKGYDRASDTIDAATKLIRKSSGEFNTSSFDDEQLAKSFGMTVEEMNEVLGKKPLAQKVEKSNSSEQNEDLEKSFDDLEDDEELYKGYRTRTFPGGKRVYAEGPNAGKEVGSIRGKGGMSTQSLADKAQRKAEKKGIDSKAARKQIKEKTGRTSFDEGKHDAKRQELATARYDAGKKMDRARNVYHDKLNYSQLDKHGFAGATGEAPKSKGHQERHEAAKDSHKKWLKAKIDEKEHDAKHPGHSKSPTHEKDVNSLKQALKDYDNPKAAQVRDKNERQISVKTRMAWKEDKDAQEVQGRINEHITRKRPRAPEGASDEERDAHFKNMREEGRTKLDALHAESRTHKERIEAKVRAEHKPLTKSLVDHLENVETLLKKSLDEDGYEKPEKEGPAVQSQPVDEKMMEQGMTKETADKILTVNRKKKEAEGTPQIQKSDVDAHLENVEALLK